MITLEDNFTDVIGKAQRGLHISDRDLLHQSGITAAELKALRAGEPLDAALRRIAGPLHLDPYALEDLAHRRWIPRQPEFPHGFAMFVSKDEDMTVNSYLVWDARTRQAAAFDTGTDCGPMLDTASAEGLKIGWIFLTHTHSDHVADLDRLAAATKAEIRVSEREPVDHPMARPFRDNAQFHIGVLAVRTVPTGGHSPGQTSYIVTGLTRPLAIVGDSLFAGSIGGSADHFSEQLENDRSHLLSLQRDTVLACGHGPLTTVSSERLHNPFFAFNHTPPETRDRDPAARTPHARRLRASPKGRARKAGKGGKAKARGGTRRRSGGADTRSP